MTGKTLTLAAIVGSLLIGTSASAVLAQQGMGRGPGGEGRFVHMLQEFDTNKDGKISKEEAEAARDKMFTTIDADNDGVLTPGEFRKHREAMRAARQAEMQANAPAQNGQGQGQGNGPAAGEGQGQGPQDGTGPMNAEPPRDGTGNQFGWGRHGQRDDNDGPRQGKGRGWGDSDGQRYGMHHGGGHGMRGGDRGPGMERGGPMGDRMGAMGPRGMMRMADADENGQISKEEAVALTDKMFTQMDTDKDGFITADDLPKRGMWGR